MGGTAYDTIGVGYGAVRRPEPRFAAAIEAALGEARSVLNVGAGTGSYEPGGREVIAVEPSATMRAQRPSHAAPAVAASAERLPFADDSFDAAMAIITVHHWADPRAGIDELARVARRRVVVLSFDPEPVASHWLVRDYCPRLLAVHRELMDPIQDLPEWLGGAEATVLPAPRLCRDGFWCALWDRPELQLDPAVRRGSSGWHRMSAAEIGDGLAALRADLASGAWDARNGHLREGTPELDIGLRLIVAELG